MKIRITGAFVYDTDSASFRHRDIYIDGQRFATDFDGADEIAMDGMFIIPGLVDVHTHGRAGGDFCQADSDMIDKIAESYLASGVTTLMPTLASAPYRDLLAARDRLIDAKARHKGADFAGIHFEGRYLNPKKRGAHAPELLAPLNPAELDELLPPVDGAIHITAAFELDPDGEFAKRALNLGATLGLGHTMATFAEARIAEAHGVTSYTHLYNAMPALHHRDGGAVCASFVGDSFAELICDGFHICPEMVKLAYSCKGQRLVLITDSMEATGCADGEYTIAGMPVTVTGGKAWTHDGAIAGSTLNLLDGVRNLSEFAGIDFAEAVRCATASPAMEVGIYDTVGSIDIGKYADFLVLGKNMTLRQVWHRGERRFNYE